MFQGHAGTGLLFLAGIAVASPWMAAGAVVGAILGPLAGLLIGAKRDEIAAGLYGFNATLVGVALMALRHPSGHTWALILVGSVLATVLTWLSRRFLPFPTYTAPFVVATWIVLALAGRVIGWSDALPSPAPEVSSLGFVGAMLDGVAEVMLGANALTGVLFLVGIALSQWRHAAMAALGSAVGTFVAIYHHDPDPTIAAGLFGYNAALAAMAVSLWRPSLLVPILGAVISVPLTEFFPRTWGVPALTAPFVVATWAILALGSLESKFFHRA